MYTLRFTFWMLLCHLEHAFAKVKSKNNLLKNILLIYPNPFGYTQFSA